LLFTVSTLDYLAKGGRIGRAAALAGNLLSVKPILTISGGEVVPLKRVRGNAKAFAEFRSIFESTSTDSPSLRVGIAHAAAPERLAALRELVEHVRPHAQIEIATTLGAVVGTHAGPGTVGFFWVDDPD
jgi:DegV family protein with EDD domain